MERLGRRQFGYDPGIAIAQLKEAHRRAQESDPQTEEGKQRQELRAAYDPSLATLIQRDLTTHELLRSGLYPPLASIVEMRIELNQVGEQERSHAPQQGV